MNLVTSVAQAHSAIAQALADGTSPQGLPAALLLQRESLKVFFYEPRGEDLQTPHEQDEVYVIMRGAGTFAIGDGEGNLKRMPFGPGDVIFTPAGALHRFEEFTDDFATWVIMYGPPGGERPGESLGLLRRY